MNSGGDLKKSVKMKTTEMLSDCDEINKVNMKNKAEKLSTVEASPAV